MKLLIIADDFTGALDTGVQFAARGASTCVVVDPNFPLSQAAPDIQVLVLDSETRHLPGPEAYDVVYRVVKEALAVGFTHIYKKTDSALRGNIGCELTAVLDASGEDAIAFSPAFPKMNRATLGGIHYIDGIPVAQSVFGQDPFEPVTNSSVADIIHQSCTASVVLHGLQDDPGMTRPGIHVYDGKDAADQSALGHALGADGIRLSAGCAGFASVVADMLLPAGGIPALPERKDGLFVVCGSVNPVTLRQIAQAESAGFAHIHMTPEQKLEASWTSGTQKQSEIARWLALAETGRCVLDVNDPEGCDDTKNYASAKGMTTEDMRVRIAANLAAAVKDMLDGGLDQTILCTGGDTLLALMKQVGVSQLVPVCELATGVVLTRFRYHGRDYDIISKSGGFGDPDLFIKLADSR